MGIVDDAIEHDRSQQSKGNNCRNQDLVRGQSLACHGGSVAAQACQWHKELSVVAARRTIMAAVKACAGVKTGWLDAVYAQGNAGDGI